MPFFSKFLDGWEDYGQCEKSVYEENFVLSVTKFMGERATQNSLTEKGNFLSKYEFLISNYSLK